ncbi:MAG: ADYC domain-containing protein, partial [Nannocystaceae bacterium]
SDPLGDIVPRSGFRGCVVGPPVLNTHVLNGLPTPELRTDGGLWGGTKLRSVTVGQDPTDVLEAVWVEDAILHGLGVSGASYEGGDFVGSVWLIDDGRHAFGTVETELVISGFIDDGPRSRYSFEHRSMLTEWALVNTCQPNSNGDDSAIVFQDLHVDTDGTLLEQGSTLYFGCTSGAVGKAAMWGYAPSEVGMEGYQAATRAVRADYCGDGVSWTATGTPLYIGDALGIHGLPPAPGMQPEAYWGPDGAACLHTPRLFQWEYADVTCSNGVSIPMCEESDGFDTLPGILLWTKPAT